MFRLNRNNQKTNPNSLKESIFEYVSENLWLFWFVSKLFYLFWLFRIGSKHRNKPKYFVFGFTKQIETQSKQILFWFRFGANRHIFVCLFRGHPKHDPFLHQSIPPQVQQPGGTFPKTRACQDRCR